MMLRRLASFLGVWLWPAIAAAQVAGGAQMLGAPGRGAWIDPRSICPGFTYTYNMSTGACSTNDPAGCQNNLSGGLTIGSGNASANDTVFQRLAEEAQKHTRPAVQGWWNGGYWIAGNYGFALPTTTSGSGTAYGDASRDNCIVVSLPAGLIQMSAMNYWPMYIRRLSVVGAGSDQTTASPTELQEVADSSHATPIGAGNLDYTNLAIDAGESGVGNLGYFIQTASAGQNWVQLSGSASNVSAYWVGGWVAILSYDQEFVAYPIDWRYYDFAKVLAVNASSGVITLDRPLYHTHIGLPSGYSSSTFTRPYCVAGAGDCPSSLTDGPTGTPGPARILPIDTPTRPVGVYWQFTGIEGLQNTNEPGLGLGNEDCWRPGTGVIVQINNDIHDEYFCHTGGAHITLTNNSEWSGEESDKMLDNVILNNTFITSYDESHAGEGNLYINGGFWQNAYTGSLNGNMANHMHFNNVLMWGATVSCSDFHPGIYLDTTGVDGVSLLSVNGSVFVGNGCSANGPIGAPQGYNTYGITLDGTTNTITTGPNGADTEIVIPNSGLTGQSGDAFIVASQFTDSLSEPGYQGSAVWKNSTTAPVSGCYWAGVEGNATSIIAWTNSASCTFATGNVVWGSKVEDLSVTNSNGVNTSYTWGGSVCSGNAGFLRYPNGNSMDLQAATCSQSNNSGN
jgi:hypothetical protein